jgi:hypothetical protein
MRSAGYACVVSVRLGRQLNRIRRVDAREQTHSSRALGTLLLCGKVFEDLNTDFFGDRAFHSAHSIPEPDDFLLFFDVHEQSPKIDPN